jgi:hypothetical protein
VGPYKRNFLQEESLPIKRRILEKEKGKKRSKSKGKEVKPHLLIQGHEKHHEKRMRNSRQVGETF